MCSATTSPTSGTTPSKLVRGLSNTPHDKLAPLVLAALKDEASWQDVTPEQVEVKDCSGHGGCKTFKISVVKAEDKAEDESPKSVIQLSPVVLHSRLEDHDEHLMRRLSDAHAVFAQHGLAPPRMVEGGDWFIGKWEGDGSPGLSTLEDLRAQGALFGKVHAIPTAWFDQHREALIQRAPHLAEAPQNSHVWAYGSRGFHGDNMCQLYSSGAFEKKAGEEHALGAFLDMGPLGPTHPLASRAVTTHGDLHCGNVLKVEAAGRRCIDFEFTCVSGAYLDLGSGMAQASWSDAPGPLKEKRRAFLEGYVEALGEQGTDIEALMFDAVLAGGMAHFHSGKALYCPWRWSDSSPQELLGELEAYKRWAAEVRASPALRAELLEESLREAIEKSEVFKALQRAKMASSECYQKLQAELDESGPEGRLPAAGAAIHQEAAHQESEGLMDGAELVTIRAANEAGMVVQVRPGTDRLELAALDIQGVSRRVDGSQVDAGEAPPNQVWRWKAGRLQHARTGLFLDAEVSHAFNHRGKPWEAGGACWVRPYEAGGRQTWLLEGQLLRHELDGRALDANFWQLAAGIGVNLNVPHTTAFGCSWVMHPVREGEALPVPPAAPLELIEEFMGEAKKDARAWLEYREMAAAKGGRLPTVYELKAAKVPEEKDWGDCWVPIRLTGAEAADPTLRFSGRTDGKAGRLKEGVPEELKEGENAWACISKKRPYTMEFPKWGLEPGRGVGAPSGCPSEAFFMSRGPEEPLETAAAPACEAPIAEVPEGAAFYIAPAKSPSFCMAVGKDEENPTKVKLAKITGDDRQKWTLEDGDAFRNVATGEYLDSDTQYAFIQDLSHIWERNHTDLVTAPRNLAGGQKWCLGPEEFHGGKVLRHYLDGRGVDVHGWKFKDDGNMGVENSVHGTCDGISYVLRICDEVNLEELEAKEPEAEEEEEE